MILQKSNRAGVYMNTLKGYKAFIPATLPPNPPILIDEEMQHLLSDADRNLGRLDGITQIIPNPELFVAMYVKKEAVLSSQIEGTQASLVDVLNVPAENDLGFPHDQVAEVVNYVNAVYTGLGCLDEFPLSLRLIRKIHEILLNGVRGANKNPGEFRTSQNWIGPPGCTLNTASFVPPAVDEMNRALSDLEMFMHAQDNIPPLIKIAIIHAQFETIHPFLDGNGRMGRLLITFWLCQQQILERPLLYLSYYFKQYRSDYYDLLMGVRNDGDWESWIKFFLRGVSAVSCEAVLAAKKIFNLRANLLNQASVFKSNENNARRLIEVIFEDPIVTKKQVAALLNVSDPTAGSLVNLFCKEGILMDLTPEKKRYKKYAFSDYLDILGEGTEL
ncbi:Fic family protein [Bittarella massiliensis (ex Durand et al. 2017)]|uniref:Fic family protein n=1 Tax=Bittarella massiliensis (ex Durand et al. 2017) TaxID=1720313 RepID=UPI001FAB7CF3|nr:Fic family protein [Bittarella massiliensis (ex Durand et al. 2017)]